MVKRPVVIPGCLLRKFSPEKLVQGVRLEDYCKDDCAGCGFNVMEDARRKQRLRSGGLEKGWDGLRRLYLGEEDTSSGADAPPSPQGEGFDKEGTL